jgi:hypothetical protein
MAAAGKGWAPKVEGRAGSWRAWHRAAAQAPTDGNKSLYLVFVGVVFSQYLGLLLEQLGQQHLGCFVRTTGQQHFDCF